MRTWMKAGLVSLALGGLLAGCATYDYGYAYDQPYYYGYGYNYGPGYYDYPYYGPAYYYGGPAIGLNFGYSDFDRHGRAYRRHSGYRSRDYTAQHRANSRPAPVSHARGGRPHARGSVATTTRHAVPRAPAPGRAQRGGGGRRDAQSSMRAEQQ